MFSFWQASYERNDLTQGFEEPWKTLPICFPCWTCGEFWKRNCLPVINYQQIPPEAEPFSFQESYSITQFNMSLMPVTQCTMYWFVSYVPTVIFHRHIGGFSWLLLCSQNSGVRTPTMGFSDRSRADEIPSSTDATRCNLTFYTRTIPFLLTTLNSATLSKASFSIWETVHDFPSRQ